METLWERYKTPQEVASAVGVMIKALSDNNVPVPVALEAMKTAGMNRREILERSLSDSPFQYREADYQL